MVLRWAWDRLWGVPATLPTPEPVEERAAETGHAETYFDALGGALSTGRPSAQQTAAVGFVHNELSRAFMLAVPEPGIRALSPEFFSLAASELVWRGNAMFRIVIRQGEIVLLPASGGEVTSGTEDPVTWRYGLEFRRPGRFDPAGRNVAAEGVVHFRVGTSAYAPWLGVSGLARAGMTADQMAYVEDSIKLEVRAPVAHGVVLPHGASEDNTLRIANALGAGDGRTQLLEAQGGLLQDNTNNLRDEYNQKDFGPRVPASSLALRDSTGLWLLAAQGVPPSLKDGAGGALREAYRHFFTATVKAWAAMMAAELNEKLEQSIEITFPEIAQADIAARGRVFVQLVANGRATFDSAKKVVGLEGLEERAEADDEADV